MLQLPTIMQWLVLNAGEVFNKTPLGTRVRIDFLEIHGHSPICNLIMFES